jgi:hypothetical protein
VIALRAAEKKPRILALSGVMLALSIALLYLSTIVPVLDFSIYILISFFTGIILQEANVKWAWLFFCAMVILTLILPVNKLAFLLLYSFFGYYGIAKFYFEKIKNKLIGFLLKLVLINIALLVNFFLASAFLPGIFADGVQLYIIIPVASAFVFLYDYIYSLVIVFYNKRLAKIIRRG